jgi:NAD(P)-dependent dehydrogenase (short-subunit alcohol dehydrogenase family)
VTGLRTVVVTGAAAGIGEAIARRLVADRWRVIAVDTDAAGLDALAARAGECGERGGGDGRGPALVPLVGDVTEVATLTAAVSAAGERLDGWVNNAAIPTHGRFDEESDERIDRTLAVNLRAPLLGCREAVRAFLRQGVPGAIVNVSSIHAHGTLPGWVAYAAAKGGVEALTRGVCVEYGQLGIRCNAVAPGAVLTAATRAMLDASSDAAAELADWERLSPMRQVLEPDDVAAGVAFLLSAEARHLNGHVLRIDAGMSATGATAEPLDGLERVAGDGAASDADGARSEANGAGSDANGAASDATTATSPDARSLR